LKISYIVHVLARIQSQISQPQALILVPTIELAFTVGSGIEKMSVYLPNIQITYAVSSLSLPTSFTTPIVIGTIDTFDSFQSLIDFSQLELLIIDEIDTMIIREDYRKILLNLIDNLPLINHCQILVYSSTLSEQIMNFTNQLIPNSILIKQRSDKQQLFNIEQFYVQCQDENKKFEIINIILKQFINTQIMIFCSDDQTTEQLYDKIMINKRNEYVFSHYHAD
jgi:ATP-dependent RNA helicase DDX19/DBP5